jgi:uncharacterized metal-binding protein YceD (DUF177 family)
MKIEFRKIPQVNSEFEIESDSVKFSGIFSKISTKLAKLSGKLDGPLQIQCCRCGKDMEVMLNEKIDFLLSDGIYKDESEDDLIVIEVDEGVVDFDAILQSELNSYRSDFYECSECKNDTQELEIEY